jgi:uncharacterized protein (DUF885 family)
MSAFARLVDDYIAFLTSEPDQRVFLGVDRDLGALNDPSLAHAAAQVVEAKGLLARLDATPAVDGDFDQQMDADLMRLMLERQIHDATYRWNGRTTLQQLPRGGDAATDGIFLIFANDPRPDGERLADITARVEQIPEMLEGMLARLDHPLQRWVDIDVEKVDEAPQLLTTVLGWAEEIGWPDELRLRAACEVAADAMAGYVEGLKALPTTTQIHLDEGDARRLVELRGIERSFEELHAIARDFLAGTGATIEALRQKLVARHGLPADTATADLQKWLNGRFKTDIGDGPLEAVLDRYQAERTKILAFIAERDLFPVLDDQDMHILRTPGFMEPSIPAGAMMPPPPLREGTRRSLVYLTLSQELLDEHTELTIPTMMVHEGIPGHHLQLATAATHPSPVRRTYDSNDWAEGWTTMLEDYMLDLGYMGELEDEARFCGKRDLSRIGARVVIDLFFMTGNRDYLDVGVDCDVSDPDPFVAAGNLLQAVTGFVPGRVQAELNWYSQERGYPLSYLLGNRTVTETRAELVAVQQGRLEGLELDRAFHRIFLGAGNMPSAWLRRLLVHEGLLPAG